MTQLLGPPLLSCSDLLNLSNILDDMEQTGWVPYQARTQVWTADGSPPGARRRQGWLHGTRQHAGTSLHATVMPRPLATEQGSSPPGVIAHMVQSEAAAEAHPILSCFPLAVLQHVHQVVPQPHAAAKGMRSWRHKDVSPCAVMAWRASSSRAVEQRSALLP